MDLIYTNSNKVEQGVILNYTYDEEENQNDSSSCTFEIQIDANNNVLEIGSLVYFPGEALGGKIDTIKVETSSKTITASGKTWKGMFADKLLYSTTEDYFTKSGRLDTVIKELVVDLFGMGDFYNIVANASAPNISLNVENYTDLYTAIVNALNSANYKAVAVYSPNTKKVNITLKPIDEYIDENIITSDMFEFKIQKSNSAVTHGIGIADGEDAIHRYLQADGTIGSIQYYTSVAEITKVYDASGETEAERIEVLDNLMLNDKDNNTLEINALNILSADVGDIIAASDILTGINMLQRVKRKITTINRDIATYQYEVGEI